METEAHKCRFTVQIDAAVDEQAFAAPSFRYRFLDGSKKQTPVLGASGWAPLGSSESDGNHDLDASAALTSRSPSLGLLPPPPHNTLRYEHVVADISVTEAFASALDDDPVLSFFFADHAGLAAGTGGGGAAAPASTAPAKDAKGGAAAGSKGGVPATAPGDTGTIEHKPRAYAGLYELDVSSLLAGHVLVEQCWASHRAASDSNNNNSSDDSDSSATPSIFASKTASASSPSASLFAMLPPEAAGLSYLAIRVRVDQPLLSATLAKKLNPLTLTLSSIRRLPGIASRTGSSPHAALRQCCRPVYASFRLFPDKLRSPQPSVSGGGTGSLALPRRLVATPGKLQDANIDWHHRVTFLSARFDRAELLDALQYATLAVEVHDRDLVQTDTLGKLVAKWDALYTTGIDITTPSHRGATGGAEQHATSSGNASRTTTPRTGASHPLQQQQAKPLDIFTVDDVARRDCHRLLLRANELFPHGVATFRLNELLNGAKQLVGSSSSATPTPSQSFMAYKLTTDVVAMKRRAKPLGARASSDDDESDPLAVFDLTPTEKLVREPGAYLASGTTLSLHVALQHPLNPIAGGAAPAATPLRRASLETVAASRVVGDTAPILPSFSRMILIIPYKDTRTLHQVTRVMTSVNLAALPGVPLRSYQMTDDEKLACIRGQLDVITGTQIIDSQFRTIVLEGLADHGMQRVHEQIPRPAALNDPHGVRMCANDRIRFTERLYTAFEVDLKRIKLRYALPVLLTSPDIYMRTKVSEQCFQALTRLADVRHASCLEDVKRLDLFPTAAMLIEVESKYGESITLEDIHGASHASKSSSGHHRQDVPDPIDVTAPETPTDTAVSSNNSSIDSGSSGESATKTSTSKRHVMTLKAPTDATNDAFEQLRKSRKDKDFLAARKQELDAVRTEYAEKKKLADALLQSQPAAPVYMYSGQKLRTQDALQDEMRKRLAKDHRATYTYSHEFQSLAVSLVDPDALRQTEELASRKQWTTQRGFVYPLPRQPSEYYKHKDAPSLARCEDLREPFVDNVNHPQPVSRGSDDPNSSSRRCSGALPAFSTLPSKDMVFGGTNADGSVNAEYFRSVHLCGEGLRQEQDEALKRELAEWERRLVVDKAQLKFLAHGNITSVPRKKPTQLDKITDLLQGPVRSKPLRIVKNATLPSGKRVPLEAPPVTIHNQQEYAGSVATQFASTLRVTDAAQFTGPTSAVTGKPQDFVFPSMTHALTPAVKQHVSRKEIAPVAPAEKTGLLWRND